LLLLFSILIVYTNIIIALVVVVCYLLL